MLHIAERHAGLLPNNANARARAIAWMFAALSTVEPVIVQREVSLYLERDKRVIFLSYSLLSATNVTPAQNNVTADNRRNKCHFVGLEVGTYMHE